MTAGSDAKPKTRGDVPRYQPLVVVLAAGAAGIVVDRYCPLPVALWWAVAVAAWLGWLLLWRRRIDGAAGLFLLLAVAACGGAWHHCRWHLFAADDLGHYARRADQPICVEALALTGPRIQLRPRDNPMRLIPASERTRVEVELVGLRNGSDWQASSGLARLSVDGHLLGVHAGDRLRIFAQLALPHTARNPGEFDFAAHARGDRRRAALRAEFPECVQVVQPVGLFSPRHWIQQVRTAGDRLFWTHLKPDQSGLAAAILLGAREEVANEQTEAFMQTGTVHILSISGMHVGIVAAVAFVLMRLLLVPRVWSVVIVSLCTVLYTVLTDAEPPAVRAAILVVVGAVGFCLGRRPLAFNTLAAAGLVVLAMNPADLFRTGVQLSFLCMAGLMWMGPGLIFPREERDPLAALIRQSRPWPVRWTLDALRWLARLTLGSAGLWLLTTPLIMARFHLFSPVALVLNTILWVPMTLAMVTGFGLLVCGVLLPPLGTLFGWCCDRTFWMLEAGVNTARHVPGSYFWVPGPADWWLAGFYLGLGLLAVLPALRPPRRWCLALACGWLAVGFTVPWLRAEKHTLQCTFLAVDHGCAAVLELPSGATLLYDAGQFSSPEVGTQAISAYLWSRGKMRVDAILLSHPDADHYNAVPGLLERFRVGQIYVPPLMFDERGVAVAAVRKSIRRARVPIREIYAGDRLRADDACTLEVLHPPRRGVIGSNNANSLVLAVEYQGRRILLPGDLETPGLEDVTAEEPRHFHVLLAPHHASRRSKPEVLSKWCTPDWVVISGGMRWRVDDTRATFEAAGAQVLHTGHSGAIRVTIDPQGLAASPLLGLPAAR